MPYGIPQKKGGDSAANVKKMESCVLQVTQGGKSKEAAIRICKAGIFDEGMDTLKADELTLAASCKKQMYSEIFEEVIDQSWSKKIIDMMYSKGLDATKFQSLLFEIKDYFLQNKYWSAVKTLDDGTINEIIDECAEECGYIQDEAGNWIKQEKMECGPEVCCNEGKTTTMWTFSDMSEFKEVKEGDKVDIQIMRTGKWNHPMYGEVIVTPETINDVVKNFNNNTRGIDLAVDENHEPNHKALGWYKELKKIGDNALNASIELTKMGADLINQGAYKYFSPEIAFNKKDEETGKTIKNLLIGGAFTNRPFFKAMQPLMASEVEVANGFSDTNRDILFFNTNSSMKTILDLLGKFAEATTLSKEDKDLLTAKFSELSDEDKTEELKSAVAEATVEVVPEVVPEVVAPEVVAEATPEVVAASEAGNEITIKASEYESLKGLATQASKLISEKRKDLMTSKVGALAFSETNKTGVVLPKMVDEVVSFAMSLSEAQSEKFLAIVGKFQTVAASEIGHDGSAADIADKDVVNFFMEKLHMTEAEAIVAANEAKKELL